MPAIIEAVRGALLAAATPGWANFKHSDKDAEEPVRAALAPVLRGFGFEPEPRARGKFRAFWRTAKTDGVWVRNGAAPQTLALEVKVGEDEDAPIGQLTDDLGAFEAALGVRVYTSERVRSRIEDDDDLVAAKQRCEGSLPVGFVSLRFCGICRRPLASVYYPHLVCDACDQLAVNDKGEPAHVGLMGARATTRRRLPSTSSR